MPDIQMIKPQGICRGVRRAIEQVVAYRNNHPGEPMTLFGPLVHNSHVTKALQNLNIDIVYPEDNPEKTLASIREGTVVFSAHGIARSLVEQARRQGLEVLDLSCPYVLHTRSLIERELENGKDVLYIGKSGHPEARAVLSLSGRIHLVENTRDVESYAGSNPVFVTNQTTMSVSEIDHLFGKIRSQMPEAVFSEEVCSATRLRQEALKNLDPEQFDLLVVAGDPSSNNTFKLAQTALERGFSRVIRIEDSSFLTEADFQASRIAVTSGASTPGSITDDIVRSLLAGKTISSGEDEILSFRKASNLPED